MEEQEQEQAWDELFRAADEYGFNRVDVTLEQVESGEISKLANIAVSWLRLAKTKDLLLVYWRANRSLSAAETPPKHSHYFKDVRHLDEIDVYRVLDLFGVTDPCIGHAVKKLLVPGNRGGGKDRDRDIQEAIDSLERYKEMRREENEINRNEW